MLTRTKIGFERPVAVYLPRIASDRIDEYTPPRVQVSKGGYSFFLEQLIKQPIITIVAKNKFASEKQSIHGETKIAKSRLPVPYKTIKYNC